MRMLPGSVETFSPPRIVLRATGFTNALLFLRAPEDVALKSILQPRLLGEEMEEKSMEVLDWPGLGRYFWVSHEGY